MTRRKANSDRFDSQITLLLRMGLSAKQIEDEIGCGPNFVRRRARKLGVLDLADANGERRRSAVSRQNGRRFHASRVGGRTGVKSGTVIIASDRRDDSASRLIRTLRYHASALDSAHMIACLHTRGVTLDDMEQHLGVPPIEAVAAIRRHCPVIVGGR